MNKRAVGVPLAAAVNATTRLTLGRPPPPLLRQQYTEAGTVRLTVSPARSGTAGVTITRPLLAPVPLVLMACLQLANTVMPSQVVGSTGRENCSSNGAVREALGVWAAGVLLVTSNVWARAAGAASVSRAASQWPVCGRCWVKSFMTKKKV